MSDASGPAGHTGPVRRFAIGEVAELLGVRPHVLRYWEQEIPFLRPRKNAFGRREYSAPEIDRLCRLRHLLYVSKYTIQGARERMWQELSVGDLERRARVAEMRADLIALWARLKQRSRRIDSRSSAS